MALGVCEVDGCGISTTHSWKYRLTARVAQTRDNVCWDGVRFNDAHLTGVTFTTTAVDNGDVITALCTEGAAVSPTSQTWSATDLAFSCNVTCGSVTGPTIQILYQ
jgi:hypothetical protein